MGIADIQSPPVNAPVNISHHLLSLSVLVADVEHVAAIVVTVAGQRPNIWRHPWRWGTAPTFYDAYGQSKYQLLD